MPRYRKLHVKATESLDINEMPDDFTRLLWVMLPLGLDSAGRGIDNPAWVKAKIMPLRADVTHTMIEGALTWFAVRGMIERYQVGGRAFFWLPTFAHYQGDTRKEAASEYPAPLAQAAPNSVPTPDLLQSKSATDADSYSDANADAMAPAAQQQPVSADAAVNPNAKAIGAVYQSWEEMNPRRQVTPLDADKLSAMIDEYGAPRVLEAIRAANDHGKPFLAYIDACLRNKGTSPDPPPKLKPKSPIVRVLNPVTDQIEEYNNETGEMRVIRKVSDGDHSSGRQAATAAG